MSTATTILRQTDDSVANWLTGVVTGEGQSVSQLLVSGVLSVIPGVGQVMDVRDVILGIIALTKNPRDPMLWADMVITLVGIVPGFGDALKVAFKFIRAGYPLGRVLDAVSPHLRGDVEKWLRTIDWQDLSTQLTKQFKEIVTSLITTLNERMAKFVLGDDRVAYFNRLLQEIYDLSDDMILAAVNDIKIKTGKVLEQPKPHSTHAVADLQPPSPAKNNSNVTKKGEEKPAATENHTATTPKKSKASEKKTAESETPNQVKHDNTDATTRQKSKSTPDVETAKTNKSKKRSEEMKSWYTGVLGEHITDYYVYQQQKNLKISDKGKLFEEKSTPHGQGIDHIWRRRGKGPGSLPIIVGETKSSLAGFFAFASEFGSLTQSPWKDEGKLPRFIGVTDENRLIGKNADGKLIRNHKGTPMQRLSTTKTKGHQMSHLWICLSLPTEEFRSESDKTELLNLAEAFKENDYQGTPPWDRWVCLVTAKQKAVHERKRGHKHQIQIPIIVIPFDTLKK